MKKTKALCLLTIILATATPAVPLYLSDYYSSNVCMSIATVLLLLTFAVSYIMKITFDEEYCYYLSKNNANVCCESSDINNEILIKENIRASIITLICVMFIGLLLLYFCISVFMTKELSILVYIGTGILAVIGFYYIFGSVLIISKIIKPPYLKLTTTGISGTAIKKELNWNEIKSIIAKELPEWYWTFLQVGLTYAYIKNPSQNLALRNFDDNLDEEHLHDNLVRIFIEEKNGKQYLIKLDPSITNYPVKETIEKYLNDNNISIG